MEIGSTKNPNETNSRTIEHFNVMVDYKSDGVGGRAAVKHALYPIPSDM